MGGQKSFWLKAVDAHARSAVFCDCIFVSWTTCDAGSERLGAGPSRPPSVQWPPAKGVFEVLARGRSTWARPPRPRRIPEFGEGTVAPGQSVHRACEETIDRSQDQLKSNNRERRLGRDKQSPCFLVKKNAGQRPATFTHGFCPCKCSFRLFRLFRPEHGKI